MSFLVPVLLAFLTAAVAEPARVACGDRVPPAAVARTFTVPVASRTYILGTIPAAATAVPCEADGAIELVTRLRERTVMRVSFTSASGATWALDGATGEPLLVHLPRGAYRIDADGAHVLPFTADVQIGAERKQLVLALRPSRTIEGVVRDAATAAPVAGASIGDAITDSSGRFALEIDFEQWPHELVVRADGYGTRTVAVPGARADTTLPDITLDHGATIVAEIHQTEAHQVTAVDLLELRNGGRTPGRVLQHLELPKSDELVRGLRLENVQPGAYVVLAAGAEPSHRAGVRVDVEAGDPVPVHVQIEPFRLRLRTVFAGEPLRNARVILRHHEAFWEASIPLDTGEATVELWQSGKLSATAAAPDVVPYRSRRTLAEPKDTEWLLEMPGLEVVGNVIDAESGAPIPKAGVALKMRSRGHNMLVSTETNADGEFRFAPVFPGEHELQAAAARYPVTEVTYSFGEEEKSHSVTIALPRTPMTTLEVLDARGQPVLAADYFVYRGQARVARGRTGANGRAAVFIPAGEARDVIVVPRDGSLGVTRIQSGIANARLTLADGTSRIVVRMESEAHEPIPDLTLDVRYNGLLLPIEVLQALAGRGSRTSTDAEGRIVLDHMPPGVYEIWPVAAPALRGAPLRLVAVPGENMAVMTFAPVG